jgi:FtsX-like permease family
VDALKNEGVLPRRIRLRQFRMWLSIMGRLKAGVTPREALADLEPMFRSSMHEAAAGLSGLPFDPPASRRSNLARASARQKEIAVRLTTGAGRWCLILQLIIESILLALGGGSLGLLLAFLADRSLVKLMSHSNSAVLNVRPDTTVLGFTLLVSMFTALLLASCRHGVPHGST